MPTPPADRAAAAIERLSPRRRELLELLARGLTNEELARALGISPATVRTHVTAVLSGLDVTNRTEAAALFATWEAQPARVERVMQRPAIAVLPLLALDADPRVARVAAGLTDDLASLLARWCWFPVISTLSSAHGRALGQSAREVGAALGARFLVDGGLRQGAGGVRISLRIDDAESGALVWTEQHEVPWPELLERQDALCHDAVAAAYPLLVSRALAPAATPTARGELAAWELAHEGLALRARREAAANAEATLRLREATRRDPSLVLAHFGLGLCAYDALLNQWAPEDEALCTLHAGALRCLDLAPHCAEGHFLLARFLQSQGDWAPAIAPLERAVGQNPSFALAHAGLSQSLQATGRAEESLVRMRHAVRLGPRAFQAGLSTLHFMQADYAEALAAAEGALVTTPDYAFARALAAASAWWLGDGERGGAHLRALGRSNPTFRPTSFTARFGPQVDAVGRLAQALEALSHAS